MISWGAERGLEDGTAALRIAPGGLDDPRVVDLLRHHLVTARAESPPCSAHALDLAGLKAPKISFWSIRRGESL